jgi:hypothetical protein
VTTIKSLAGVDCETRAAEGSMKFESLKVTFYSSRLRRPSAEEESLG